MNKGPFGAVLAFAAAHNHPTIVHNCPNIQKFQTAYPAAVVRPIKEVPPAIVAWGLSLLAQASTNVKPPPVPAPAGASPPSGSRSLLSHVSLSHGGDPPSDGLRAVRTLVGVWIPPVIWFPPAHIPRVAHPPCPDPDGIDTPLFLMGGRLFRGYVGSSPVYGGFPQGIYLSIHSIYGGSMAHLHLSWGVALVSPSVHPWPGSDSPISWGVSSCTCISGIYACFGGSSAASFVA
jgi:hypothetical protein